MGASRSPEQYGPTMGLRDEIARQEASARLSAEQAARADERRRDQLAEGQRLLDEFVEIALERGLPEVDLMIEHPKSPYDSTDLNRWHPVGLRGWLLQYRPRQDVVAVTRDRRLHWVSIELEEPRGWRKRESVKMNWIADVEHLLIQGFYLADGEYTPLKEKLACALAEGGGYGTYYDGQMP